eukprot:TRINITY_DN2851_c0_g1_i1.p1 TRINITY_DN2851_c0_g1~~TRINITY_DN2851_c0_g1_i1.p1  ORF type:complete len:128 (+),score=28.97 TRINITY_DN2851_c0_g1_i1:137-520(+)
MNQEEDADKLQFGKDFNEAITLFISEVAIPLEFKQKQSEDNEFNDVFDKTLEYTQRFNRYKNKATVDQVRSLLNKHPEFHKFEIAQIANLCPETAEEAMALIPSLHKHDPDVIQSILEDLSRFRKFN